jgi:hypothetical protein
LGREAVSTFYYAIQETYHIPEEDFPKRPQEVLAYFEKILGEAGFAVIKRAMLTQMRTTFRISEMTSDINRSIELARESYLHQDLHPEETVRL